MFKINFKNYNKNYVWLAFFVFIGVFFLSIDTSFAAQNLSLTKLDNFISSISKLIKNINTNIVSTLLFGLTSVATLFFVYGIARFIYNRATGKNDKASLDEGKSFMKWGLIALFVLVSMWGLIKAVQYIIGIDGQNKIIIPTLCIGEDCFKNNSNTPSSYGTGKDNNSNGFTYGKVKNGCPCLGKIGGNNNTNCMYGSICLSNNSGSNHSWYNGSGWNWPSTASSFISGGPAGDGIQGICGKKENARGTNNTLSWEDCDLSQPASNQTGGVDTSGSKGKTGAAVDALEADGVKKWELYLGSPQRINVTDKNATFGFNSTYLAIEYDTLLGYWLINPKKSGNTTVTYAGKTIKVTIIDPSKTEVTGLDIVPIGNISLKVNGKTNIDIIISPENATNKTLSWKANPENNVVDVKNVRNESDGYVFEIKALKVGATTLTFTSNSNPEIKKSIDIEVYPPSSSAGTTPNNSNSTCDGVDNPCSFYNN